MESAKATMDHFGSRLELHDLKERIESRKGLRQLESMKTLGMGRGDYQLVTR